MSKHKNTLHTIINQEFLYINYTFYTLVSCSSLILHTSNTFKNSELI